MQSAVAILGRSLNPSLGRVPTASSLIQQINASGFGGIQAQLDSVFAAAAYAARGLPDTTNASDMVYKTGTTAGPSLLLNLTKTASGGYAATFNVYVAAG